MRLWRAGVVVTALGVAAWLDACSDSPGPCFDCLPPPTTGLIVSNRVPQTSASASAGVAAAPTSPNAGDDFVYVSLTPGTVPAGAVATIERLGDVGSTITTLLDGGFDPVPVGAQPGDSIDVLVRDAAGTTRFQSRKAVAASRPPVVVRSDPPRGKTDVAINASIVIVFSEPVAVGSLSSSSVQLFQGTTPVAGTVRQLQGSGAAAAFTPTAPLSRNTAYRLVVTQAVRDLDGDVLEAGATVTFTTGQSSTGPAAELALSPDSVFMTGATYQLTATVRDAAGNLLIDQPVTWATNYPSGLTVSSTGLLTALGAGYYHVTASSGSLLGFVEVFVSAGPPASLAVSPTQATLEAAGDTIKLTATVRDAAGLLLDHPSVTWTTGDPAVATVVADSSGRDGLAFATVTGVSPGSVTITVRSGAASGSTSVTVTPPLPVASVTVSPSSATRVVQGRTQLSAVVRDANSKVLAGRMIAWTTDNAAVATVDANGLVTGIGLGSAAVSATSEGVSDTAAIIVTAISLVAVDPGASHACGLTPSGAVYCWGYYDIGELGVDSVGLGLETCRPAGFNRATVCSTTPIPAAKGFTFSSLRAGGNHTCGLTASGQAYCWGYNGYGQLGDGLTANTSEPAAVSGGLTFAALSAGDYHTCGLTTTGAAYCWGLNSSGDLGDGSTTDRLTPVAVSGGLTFSSISVGQQHTCGLTPSGAAYCWGENGAGELGDGSRSELRPAPVPVSGGLTFSALSAGGAHTCAVTTDGAAYCWGDDSYYQLGDTLVLQGSRIPMPVPVSSTLRFSTLTAGHEYTCGLTTGGAAYCWGVNNSSGDLGDGSTVWSRPQPVGGTGGLTFSAIAAMSGGDFTCGVAISGPVYCWGDNGFGQLGNGTTTNSNVPVKVAGQP